MTNEEKEVEHEVEQETKKPSIADMVTEARRGKETDSKAFVTGDIVNVEPQHEAY